MDKSKKSKMLHAKIDKLWQVLTDGACGRHSGAVRDLQREILRLSAELGHRQLVRK